jgi:hypothetical protein
MCAVSKYLFGTPFIPFIPFITFITFIIQSLLFFGGCHR